MAALVLVRATVHLPRLPLGAVALVDPDVPYVKARLAAQHIVPVDATEPEADE